MSDPGVPPEPGAASPAGDPAAAAPETKKPGLGKRLLKIALWTAGGLLVLVAATPFLLSTGWANDAVRSWLKDNVDREVSFASLSLSWSEGIELTGVVVEDEAADLPPVLEAPRIVLRMPLWNLLFRNFDVEEFAVDDPVVRINERSGSVVKLRKPRKGGDAAEGPKPEPAPAPSAAPAEPEEPTVLPDLSVPVRVKNLTLVLRDKEGRETRRPGIEFTGNLNNGNAARTTFDLSAPTLGAGSLRVRGSARLFDEKGAVLPPADADLDVEVELDHLDAQANADLLRVFAPSAPPAAGILEAKVKTVYGGGAAKGSVTIRVRDVAVGKAIGVRSSAQDDDLTVAAQFEWGGGKLAVEGLKVRAEGLRVEGGVRGTAEAMDGKIDLDADLARMAAALRTFGIETASVSGTLNGGVVFTREPSRGTGKLALTKLIVARAAAPGEPAPPLVTIDAIDAAFVAALGAEEQRLESCDVRLADVTAKLSGVRKKDGALDARLTAQGDLGRLLGRVRDLGMLPSGLSVNGSLDAAVALRGDPAAKPGEGGLVATVEQFVLSEDDVRIEAKGTAEVGGALDMTASGSGDLGKLLGRAQAATAGGKPVETIRGRFAFEASAKGPADALVVRVPKFKIDGDLNVEASAEVRTAGAPGGTAAEGGAAAPSPAIDAKLHAEGRIDDALLVARRLGFLAKDASLGGTLRADATVGGTAAAPVVPGFSLAVECAALKVGASGSLAADKSLKASAKGECDLARIAEFAQAAGFAEKVPPAKGRLVFDAEAAGTTAAPTVPRFTVTLRDGPATADVKGSIADTGRLEATANVAADLAALADFAHAAGYLERPMTPKGRATLDLQLAGTRQRVYIPSVKFDLSGPVGLKFAGSMDASDVVQGRADLAGDLQPLLDLAAQWSGGAARRLDGKLQGAFLVDGPKDKLVVTVPRVAVTAGGGAFELAASRDAQGDAAATMSLRGPLQDLLNVAHAFDAAKNLQGTGTLDASVELKLTGRRATGSATGGIANLVLTEPKFGEAGPFREPRAALLVSGISYDLDAGRLEPLRALLQCEGLKLEATTAMRETPAADGGAPSRAVSAEGTFTVEETFVRNHPELFTSFRVARVEAPFKFDGDVSRGLAGAAGWTGGADLKVTGLVAPHLTMDTARATAKIEGGAVVIDPIEGTANGGPVTGKARLGLVGDAPEHQFDLTGKDVALSGDLAPLIARVSPLFAVGEHGRTGGKANMDVHLSAKGLDAETMKRTLTGKGTLGLAGAFVESSDWIGLLLSIAGSSGRLDLDPVDVPFEVKDGRVRTGNVDMEGVGLLLRMGGEVALDGKLDYGLRLRPLRPGGSFEKYASLVDKEGFLPLRLEGNVTSPKLRAPEVKDILKGKIEDLIGGALGGGKKSQDRGGSSAEAVGNDDPPPPPPAPRKKR
jgi:hypothetical protein